MEQVGMSIHNVFNSLSVREFSIQTPIYKQMSSFWMWRKANYIDFDSFRMSLVVALLYLVLMFVGIHLLSEMCSCFMKSITLY